MKEGKNEYTIKVAEYDFDVFTSADPYEYFSESDVGEESFDLKRLLDDYGWKEIENPYDDYSLGYDRMIKEGRTYSFESGDMTILLQLGFVKDAENNYLLLAFRYSFVRTGSLKEPYYSFIELNYAPTNDAVCDMQNMHAAECVLDEEYQVHTSKDTCVFLAATVSWVDIKPEVSPFRFFKIPFYPILCEDDRKSTKYDYYEI